MDHTEEGEIIRTLKDSIELVLILLHITVRRYRENTSMPRSVHRDLGRHSPDDEDTSHAKGSDNGGVHRRDMEVQVMQIQPNCAV
jgi:hypothetical protein